MTFEDWVKEELGIEAYKIEHLSPEEQKEVKFIVSVDALIKLWNAGVENGSKGSAEKLECVKNRNAELAGQKASLERWLGEARVIIKGLLESCFGPTSKTVNYEVKTRAEQFLKEV